MTTPLRVTRSRLLTLLTVAFVLLATALTPALAAGGDQGACEDGYWMKADWHGGGWSWEVGPAWDEATPAPTAPALTVTVLDEDGEPWEVSWTSTVPVASVTTKAGQLHTSFPGGTSGTVTGAGEPQHAISNIVFCYPGTEPPTPTGDLVVTKSVEGEAPSGATFAFAAGEASFTLTDGGSHTLAGLPAGTTVTVTETDDGGADGTSVDGDVGISTTVTIPADDTVVVAFVNTFEPPPPAPEPAIHLLKVADVEPDADGVRSVVFDPAGPPVSITYTYTITNSGDTPLTGVTLVDDVLGTITLPDTALEPGEQLTVTATHTVTAADAAAGSIHNVAVTSGTSPDEVVVTDQDDETVHVTEVSDDGDGPDEPDEPDGPDEPDEPDDDGEVDDDTEVAGRTITRRPLGATASGLPRTGTPIAALLLLAGAQLALGATFGVAARAAHRTRR